MNVIAYAPLGRGFLTGKIKREDLKEGDFRLHVPRFEAEAAQTNQKIVNELGAISAKKGVTNAQLCIAWVASLGMSSFHPTLYPLYSSTDSMDICRSESRPTSRIE